MMVQVPVDGIQQYSAQSAQSSSFNDGRENINSAVFEKTASSEFQFDSSEIGNPNNEIVNNARTDASNGQSSGSMTPEDELMIKIISGGAILVILLICIGLIVKSVRHILNPNAELETKPKEI